MKAQVSIEFMIIFGVFLAALIMVVLASWNNLVNINQSSLQFEVDRVLDKVSSHINTAYLAGDGFSTNFTVPEKIMNTNFTLYYEGSGIWLRIGGKDYFRKLLTENVTGNITGGTNRIKNLNGRIRIT